MDDSVKNKLNTYIFCLFPSRLRNNGLYFFALETPLRPFETPL